MEQSSVHLTRWGDDGPVIVMVHGSAQGSEVGGDRHFAKQAELAGMGWQVVVPDRPGHGRSPSPGRPDDAQEDGKWVAELLGKGAHLVGHSFGSCVALAAAAMRPDAVRSLTLIEPAMMPLAIDDPLVLGFVKQLGEAAAKARSPAEATVNFAKIVGIPDEIRGGSSEAELGRMAKGLKELRLPTPPELQREIEVVRKAAIPLQVVEGGWSLAYGVVADRVAELGGGKHVVIKSEHHFPQLVSDEFNQELIEFMTQADRHARTTA